MERRRESDSASNDSLDSGTEEACRSALLRDGRSASWGWSAPSLPSDPVLDPVQAGPSSPSPPPPPEPKRRMSRPRPHRQPAPPTMTPHAGPSTLPPPVDRPARKASLAPSQAPSTSTTVRPLSRRSSTSSFGRPPSTPISSKKPPLGSEHAALLQSPRLTRMVQLSRAPYKNHFVSLSDVGSPSGHPVVVYLGLGGVRYLTALFDDLASSMNLRLICIDRFGLGRSDDVPSEKRGFLQWASVVEEVADQLGLGKFSILAHSAGTPFAMATCLRLGERVVGSVNLLAPWVGLEVDGGYKWLRYVPTGVIKTAQAAEWKMQGWMLGKAPSALSTEPKGPPTVNSSAASLDTSSATSTLSSYDLPEGQPLPEETLAYIDYTDRISPPLPGSEPSDYPLSRRAVSPLPNLADSAGSTRTPPSTPGRVDLGTALLRACHAESQGGAADLLAIMKKTNEWGFSYTDVKLPVKVWYGDRDEKINEKSVRWLEKELDRCTLVIKKNEGHNLLSSTRVVIEVLESISAEVDNQFIP